MTEQMGPRQLSWERERMLEALDAYRRGLCEPPVIRKWSAAPAAGETRANVTGEYEDSGGSDGLTDATAMTFVISTDEVDHHGDIISARGWQLDTYKNNPVFMWAHDYARPVIGRAVEVWSEPHSLMARMEFAPTNFAREIAGLYQAGYQRGVSVGFKPLRFEERRHSKTGALLGLRFLEQELLETSAVPVPPTAAPCAGPWPRLPFPGSTCNGTPRALGARSTTRMTGAGMTGARMTKPRHRRCNWSGPNFRPGWTIWKSWPGNWPECPGKLRDMVQTAPTRPAGRQL